MKFNFIPPQEETVSKTVRLDTETYNIVIQYGKENDIDNFSVALNTILRRISRVGTEQFYEATKVNSQSFSQIKPLKSPQIGVNHAPIFISDNNNLTKSL